MTRSEILASMRERRLRPVGEVGGRLVYPIMGGAADDDEDGDDDADEDGDEETDADASSEEDDDGDDPAKLKASRDRLKEALARANADARRNRERYKAAKAAADKKPEGSPDEAAKAIEEARVAAREPLVRKLLTASAKSAFLSAGFQGEVSERFIKLIDRDALDIDDDGEIDGLDEQVAQIKRDFPEKFKRKRTGPGDTGKHDAEPAGGKKLTASQRQAQSLGAKV